MDYREFSVAGEYHYDRAGPVRWIASHLLRYKRILLCWLIAATLANILNAIIPTLTGAAFNVVLAPQPDRARLAATALEILAVVVALGCVDLGAMPATSCT